MSYGSYTPEFRPPQADGLNPMQILRRIGSRRGLLTAVAGIAFCGLAYLIFHMEPLYTASAQVLIEAPQAQPANPLQAAPPPSADREKIASEVQVMLSRGLSAKAISEFGLAGKPEFNVSLDHSLMGSLRAYLGATGSQAEIAAKFASRLAAFPVGTSRVIAIEFTSADPQLARDVANRVAQLYIEDQRTASLAVNNRAENWMSSQIDTLRQRVAESEAKVEAYRSRTGLLVGNGVQLQSQQLSEVNTQLSAARAARAEAEARVATLRRLASAPGDDTDAQSNTQVLQSQLIQQLRQQEAQLKREVTQLSSDLLPTHPRMVQKRSELDGLEAQIKSEIEKIIESVRKEAQVAGIRETNAEREMRRLEQRRTVGRPRSDRIARPGARCHRQPQRAGGISFPLHGIVAAGRYRHSRRERPRDFERRDAGSAEFPAEGADALSSRIGFVRVRPRRGVRRRSGQRRYDGRWRPRCRVWSRSKQRRKGIDRPCASGIARRWRRPARNR